MSSSDDGQPDNPYARWLSEDNDLCIPAIDGEGLEEIRKKTFLKVFEMMGKGPNPQIYLDLEHLQIADYAAFEDVSESQKSFIGKLNQEEAISPEDLVFLALRSLHQFAWPQPESEDDIRYAAAHDFVLNDILAKTAFDRSKELIGTGAFLPYWGRLAFLRVMVNIPPENVARFGLDRVACTLMKRAKFNATTFAFQDNPVIGLNYALEPILKHLNRYLLHYFGTKEMAGPMRLRRAWEGIAPTVLHFWSDIAATKLTRSTTTIYGEEMAITAHRLTSSQLDFIVMHELGHVAFDHPNRLHKEKLDCRDVTSLRHEFEFAADTFALGLSRSHLVREIRLNSEKTGESLSPIDEVLSSLRDYQRDLCGVYLLFMYMDFVQRSGELLRDRLGSKIPIRAHMDSHPKPNLRLERLELMNVSEFLYSGKLQRYAKDFFASVLEYTKSLDDDSLIQSLDVY